MPEPPHAESHSDAELVRTIRQGVHKDGSTLFIMPSQALSHLSDEDVGKIVAWIRTLKPGPKDSLPPLPTARSGAR